MSFSKLFVRGTVFLFVVMGIMAWFKKDKKEQGDVPKKIESLKEVPKRVLKKTEKLLKVSQQEPVKAVLVKNKPKSSVLEKKKPVSRDSLYRFFSRGTDKFDFIETITYSSRVSWMKGRPAWIADYASYYKTSRHFIARSLNRKEDYDSQKVSGGDQFNVFKEDCDVQFQLVANLSLCSMDFYYISGSDQKKEFIKSYKISVGRKDEHSSSGYLTPLGKYTLGEKIAVYRPGVYNFFQNQKVEMIGVFGTRWLPFDKQVGECTDGAKGYGLHGLPCSPLDDGTLCEDLSLESTWSSDGCIRLKKRDIEELFSIIITRPTTIEILNEPQTQEIFEPQENLIVKNSDQLS